MTHIAVDFWYQILQHYPYAKLDAFVIMPDHIHGIIKIFNNKVIPDSSNTFGNQRFNLPSVIAGFKSSVKRIANKNGHDFEWQRRIPRRNHLY